MSPTKRNEPIILTVAKNDNDLTIRIDQNSWAFESFEGLPVVELKLTGCRSAARLYDWEIDSENEPLDEVLAELINSVNLALYYEVVKEADEFVISLQVNYLADGLRLYCTQISETPSDYTIEELKRKTAWLAQLYLASNEAHELSYYIYHLLKYKLSEMISKELDLYQRKIEFLSRTNPEKAATFRGEAQAYQNVLKLIGLGEVDGKPIATQVISWLPQVRYAKSVESRTANLWEAALFPLLEIIKDPEIWLEYKEAILLILGRIDPDVKQKIMYILGPDDERAQ